MIHLKIEGRLGNQMFQYAFARSIAEETNEEICIDFTNFEGRKKVRGGIIN